jgi:hypothetical protein
MPLSCSMLELHELCKIFCHVRVLLHDAFEYISVILSILHSDNSVPMCTQVMFVWHTYAKLKPLIQSILYEVEVGWELHSYPKIV